MKKTEQSIYTFKVIAQSFGLLKCREIMSAWVGEKVSRIASNQSDLKKTIELIRKLNLYYHVNTNLIFTKRDIGKGGWSNKFDDRHNPSLDKGEYLIYIANSKKDLKIALKADLDNNEKDFGEGLGIPECCINFYLSNKEKAFSKQNDYVTLVASNTRGLHSFNYWNNYVSQYFGYSFLSFFPCSFNCKEAVKQSKRSYEMMFSLLPEEAEKILYFQKQPILYTEYRGIYLFEGAISNNTQTLIDNCIIHSTMKSTSKTLKFIQNTKEIKILDKSKIHFTSKKDKTRVVDNKDWVMCSFI